VNACIQPVANAKSVIEAEKSAGAAIPSSLSHAVARSISVRLLRPNHAIVKSVVVAANDRLNERSEKATTALLCPPPAVPSTMPIREKTKPLTTTGAASHLNPVFVKPENFNKKATQTKYAIIMKAPMNARFIPAKLHPKNKRAMLPH